MDVKDKKNLETERKKKELMKLYVTPISTCTEMHISNSTSNMPRGIQRFWNQSVLCCLVE